jgi:MFS family permease
MTITEPATFVTDLLLAAIAGSLAFRLHRRTPRENRAGSWLVIALNLTAMSAFVGGCYHGFFSNFSEPVSAAAWRLTLISISGASAAMGMSWTHEIVPVNGRRWLSAVIAMKFSMFTFAAILWPVFAIAVADYASTMLAWLVAAVLLRRAWRRAMLAAIALSFTAAGVQQLRLGPTASFNHNDLYHVIQALAVAAFYRAGRNFGCALA